MERIVLANPKNSDALNYVAYALAEKGVDLDRAEGLSQQAIGIRPNDGYYLDTLGYILFKRGKMKEAEEILARAVAASGQDVVIVEHYVDVLLAQDKKPLAVGLLKSVVDVSLTAEDAKDADKVEARKRLQGKLRDLLQRHPELEGVQKSQLMIRPEQKRSQSVQGAEILRELTQSIGML